jgi:hypothetical protein
MSRTGLDISRKAEPREALIYPESARTAFSRAYMTALIYGRVEPHPVGEPRLGRRRTCRFNLTL